MTRTPLVVGAGAIVCAGLVFVGFRGGAPKSSEAQARSSSAPSAADVEGLRQQAQSMQAELVRLRQKVDQAEARKPGEPSAPERTSLQPTKPMTAEAYAATEKRYRDFLDSKLAGEATDNNWTEAAGLEAKLRAALPAGSSIDNIRCGASLCRVVTSHRNSEAYASFMGASFQGAASNQLWSGPGTFMLIEDPAKGAARLLAVMYLGRGQALPSLDSEP